MIPNRKSTRLVGYDYAAAGYYFVTICTEGKKCVLSHIVRPSPWAAPVSVLTEIGKIADTELKNVEKHYDNVIIDKYVIMPNHLHIIVRITERINPFPTGAKSDLSNIIGKFKAAVTRSVGKAFMPSAVPRLWQRSFHDRIIRGEAEYLKIWEYIDGNPAKWEQDSFYVPKA